jgi:antitoxin component YwqK of YwqJK toxin-antitoxin module
MNIMRNLLIFLFALFCLHVQAQTDKDTLVNNGYQKFYYPNGNVSSEGTMRNGQPDEYWKTYYENGTLKSEGNRKSYQLDSLWKFYDIKGNMSVMISYKEGKMHGPRTTFIKDFKRVDIFKNGVKNGISKEFDLNGNLRKTIPYKQGLEDGISLSYATDGRIIEIVRFQKGFMKNREYINRKDAQGRKQGIWKEFWPGKDYMTKSEIPYRNDRIDGYAKYYDSKGNLDNIQKYVNGVLVVDPPELAEYELRTDYYPDGSIKVIGSYKDGVAEGVRREYAQDGTITQGFVLHKGRIIGKGIIDASGQKQGAWEEYYLSGRLQAEGTYKNNEPIGLWKFYFENGQLEQTGYYNEKGQPKGEWKWYFSTGLLRRLENFFDGYEQGELIEYAADTTIMLKGAYVDGRKEGSWIERVHGYLTEGEYLDDVREGYWKSYYPNDNLYSEGNYIDDFPDGVHIWYHENGKVKRKGTYRMGLRQGEWKYFNEEGKLYLTVEFDRGVEVRYDSYRLEPEIDPSELIE